MPSIDDFMKIELKIAKIVEAADHPNADKLVVLKIDVGDTEGSGGAYCNTPVQNITADSVEARCSAPVQEGNAPNQDSMPPAPVYKQIVAGIKKSYKKEDLIGKYIVVVDNLDPAVLRGVESQGMLLAASDDEGISIVSPDRPVKLGSRVK